MIDGLDVTIHIGVPKTATTSLQYGVFLPCPLWDYLGPLPRDWQASEWHSEGRRWMIQMALAGELQYRREEPRIREFFASHCSGDRPLLISDEKLATSHYFVSMASYADQYLVAHRLKRLFPQARILIGIRNQFAFLQSLFGEMTRHLCLPMTSYKVWLRSELLRLEQGVPHGLAMGDHEALYELYAELFGRANVKVFLFEAFRKDDTAVLRDILGFMSVDAEAVLAHRKDLFVNRRPSRREIFLRKTYDRFRSLFRRVPRPLRSSVLDWGQRGKGFADYTYTDQERRIFQDYFGEGNRRLAEATGLNLEENGYPM